MARSIEAVRQNIQKDKGDGTNSMADKLKAAMAKTVFQTFALSNDMGVCPICADTMMREEGGEKMKLVLLPCNPLHAIHEECYNQFITHNEKVKQKSLCPMCRTEIDKTKTHVIDNFDPNKSKARLAID